MVNLVSLVKRDGVFLDILRYLLHSTSSLSSIFISATHHHPFSTKPPPMTRRIGSRLVPSMALYMRFSLKMGGGRGGDENLSPRSECEEQVGDVLPFTTTPLGHGRVVRINVDVEVLIPSAYVVSDDRVPRPRAPGLPVQLYTSIPNE